MSSAVQDDSPAGLQYPIADAPVAKVETGTAAGIAGLFIVFLAFLLASFPARNPEIWGRLAAGRDLANGRLPVAVASWNPDRVSNEGWLFDLVCYLLYSATGGVGLVVAKALLVAGLALILFRLCGTRENWLLATVCAAIAVLAMGTRLLLQPTIASYFCLGLTLWLIRSQKGKPSIVPSVSLLALFVIWANLDRWFLVGLIAVALVWMGRALDGPAPARELSRRLASLLLLAGVCFLNPATYHIFALPTELTVAGRIPGSSQAIRSPFTWAYWDAMSQSPVGLAYYPLFGLSLLSFLLALPRWRWERLLPWAIFAGLSAYQVRTVPFFAIVAGPILAWNLEEFFARRRAIQSSAIAGSRRRLSRVAAGAAIASLGLAFLGATWTGWLQSPPFEPRHWGIETPRGLERSATKMCALLADGRLPSNTCVLHLSPDTAATFAWHCPNLKSVREPGLNAGILDESNASDAWLDQMRSLSVSHVVVYDVDRSRWNAAVERLLAFPEQWPLLQLDGRVTVFGWRDPAKLDPNPAILSDFADLNKLALQPRPEEKAPPPPTIAPREWWDAFWKGVPDPSDERDEAAFRLLQAEALRRSTADRHVVAWSATEAAALVGAANGWHGPAALWDASTRAVFVSPRVMGETWSKLVLGQLALKLLPMFRQTRDDSPIATIYLAIRAARRAIAHDPSDAQAYATLGEAYLRLINNTRERNWYRDLGELAILRRVQAATAFHRALTLDPNQAFVHSQLAKMYLDVGFLDLGLTHQRAFLDLVRKAERTSGPQRGAYREATSDVEKQVEALSKVVDEQMRQFEKESSGLRVLDRALTARDRGLVGKARDILLASDISAFGANGLALELDLLLRTGRAQEVQDWTSPEQQEALGPRYHWFRMQAFSALGDYSQAAEECSLLAAEGSDASGATPRAIAAALVAQEILDRLHIVAHPGRGAWEVFRQATIRGRVMQFIVNIRREADAITLRGLVALEAGDIESATRDFRQALATWNSPTAVVEGRGIDFGGRSACQGALDWINSALKE